MKVTLIGLTAVHKAAIEAAGMEIDPTATGMEVLAEVAGRACYQSFHKPNPATAANKDYLANIIEQGHFSVLEHSSASFYVEGVSRSLTHELVRHRHLSYSQLSQRYVDIKDAQFVVPPALAENLDLTMPSVDGGKSEGPSIQEILEEVAEVTKWSYEAIAGLLEAKGLPRKQAREAARAVMPNMTETRIVVSGNLRAWRDFLSKRHSVHADREIQVLAQHILTILRGVAPSAVQDIPDEPYL